MCLVCSVVGYGLGLCVSKVAVYLCLANPPFHAFGWVRCCVFVSVFLLCCIRVGFLGLAHVFREICAAAIRLLVLPTPLMLALGSRGCGGGVGRAVQCVPCGPRGPALARTPSLSPRIGA